MVSCKHNDIMHLKNLGCPIKCAQLLCKKTNKKPKKFNVHAIENKKLKQSVKTLKKNNSTKKNIINKLVKTNKIKTMKLVNKHNVIKSKHDELLKRNKDLGDVIHRVYSNLNNTSLPAPGHPEKIQEPINVDKMVTTMLSKIPEKSMSRSVAESSYESSPDIFGWGKKKFKKKTVRRKKNGKQNKRKLGKKRKNKKKRSKSRRKRK